MGTRSVNFIALKPGIWLDGEAARYINDMTARISRSELGALIVYESNFSPLWARVNTLDLEEEIAVHRFLNRLPAANFRMERAGDMCGDRGKWMSHPFKDDEAVAAIIEANLAATEAGTEAAIAEIEARWAKRAEWVRDTAPVGEDEETGVVNWEPTGAEFFTQEGLDANLNQILDDVPERQIGDAIEEARRDIATLIALLRQERA